MNKKRISIIVIMLSLSIILGLWAIGIIPKQIARISATNYLKKNFGKIQLEFVDIEWSSRFGGYLIKFKDKNNEIYGFIMNNKFFPIKLGQGLFEFQEKYKEKYEKKETQSINTVTKISVGQKAWINYLTKINIQDTNDYFEITEEVKWHFPEQPKGITVSFDFIVPYRFVKDGVSYDGVFYFGDSMWNSKPKGLDYNLKVINFTDNGEIEIEITK